MPTTLRMDVDPDERSARVESGETVVEQRGGTSAGAGTRGSRAARPILARLAHLVDVLTEERAWRPSAGERVKGWWLGRLPEGWHVFHDVPVGDAGANIEHLVIGPPGVFTINTKSLTGKVWVGAKSILHNRRRTDFLPKASAEARQVSRLLTSAVGRPVEVRGVLAILCDDWTVKQRPADVYVDATRGAKDWMLRQPAVLRAHEVLEIARAASKPATWTTA